MKISVPKQSIQDKDLFNVSFAPNNHLVVSDIGGKSVKIFSLEGDQGQVNWTNLLLAITLREMWFYKM